MKDINKDFLHFIGVVAALEEQIKSTYDEVQEIMYETICELDEDEITPFHIGLKEFYEEHGFYSKKQIDTFKRLYWHRVTEIELSGAK